MVWNAHMLYLISKKFPQCCLWVWISFSSRLMGSNLYSLSSLWCKLSNGERGKGQLKLFGRILASLWWWQRVKWSWCFFVLKILRFILGLSQDCSLQIWQCSLKVLVCQTIVHNYILFPSLLSASRKALACQKTCACSFILFHGLFFSETWRKHGA